MGAHVMRDFHVTSTRNPVGLTGKLPWPTRPSGSGSGSKSKSSNKNLGMDRAVLVPNFVSKLPQDFLSKYGYQEVHTMYDKMRNFFAKRATSTYQNEVATIKVILMLMKPNNKNPQMVMVHKIY